MMDEFNNCRLCLKQDNEVLNIYNESLVEANIREKIMKYLYLDIKENDTFSKFICEDCLIKINEFDSFCSRVEKNQIKYQHYLLIKPVVNVNDLITITSGNVSIQQGLENIILEVKLPENNNENMKKKFLTEISKPIIIEQKSITKRKVSISKTHKIKKDKCKSNELNINLENRNSGSEIDCWKNQTDFPTVLIKDAKLVIRGKELIKLLSRFYKLKCNLCSSNLESKTFSWLPSLLSHYRESHSIKGYVICCETKFLKLRTMALHMAKHLQPEAFKCTECGKFLTSPRILRYHIQNHLPEEKRPLSCSKCTRRFSYSSALNAHQISHLPEEQRDSHVCDECGKKFLSAGSLTKHINLVHEENLQKFVCHECGRQFTSKGNLTYHLTTHEEIHQIQCSICQKWLKNKLCLRKHMAQHSNIRHSCTKCNYSAVNRQCLINHIKVQHSNDKPHKCEQCPRTFKLKNTLINHMVQHTGIKRYSCEFCTRLFASSGNYYTHRKRMHLTELAAYNQRKEEKQRIQRELILNNRN